MLKAKRVLSRWMAGETLPEVCAPTILAVLRRNNSPTRHSYERRRSYHSFSREVGRRGQDTCWSPGHLEMQRERKKWSLVARPQQANRRPRQRMLNMHQDQSQSSGTNDSLDTAGTPMAESCHRFVRLERSRIRTGRRLLFSLL